MNVNREGKMSLSEFCTKRLEMNTTALLKMFELIESSEQYFGKEFIYYSMSEIKLLFTSFNSISVSSLRIKCSILRRYCEYLQYAGNNYKDVTTEILEGCCNNIIRLNKYLDRPSILKIINELENPSDKWIILALYEGIRGEKLCNITLTSGAGIIVDKNMIKLYNGEIALCSRELMYIAKESSETYEYFSIATNDQIKKIMLDTSLILKPRNNCTDPYDIDKAYKRTCKKYFTIKKYIDNESLTIPRIYLSGMTYRIKQVMEEKNSTFDEVFNDIYEIRKLYGYEKYKPHELKHILRDYL